MRVAIALSLFATLAAPAWAQQSAGLPPSALATQAFGNAERQAPRFLDHEFRTSSPNDYAGETLRRAGAWGQCVVAASPEASRAYLRYAASTARLRWNFDRCRRKVGDFYRDDAVAVRRAAISDALRAPST